MPTITEHLREHCLRNLPPEKRQDMDLWTLMRTERSPEFEKLRINRKIIGAFRYGRMGYPDKKKYDRVQCMIRRLENYKADHNAEHLVDVANLAELEYVEGDGVLKSIDDGQHTQEID